MVQLKDESGFTLIETLVSMVILGLIVSITVMFVNSFFSNPKILFRAEALNLAVTELNRSGEQMNIGDTTYSSINGNLIINRSAEAEEGLIKLTVIVISKQGEKEILSLSKTVLNEMVSE